MVTVVAFFQFIQDLFHAHALFLGQILQVWRHLCPHFLFRDATDGGVFLVHADVVDIVQLAEDAQLGELGDAGQEDEAQVGVAGF